MCTQTFQNVLHKVLSHASMLAYLVMHMQVGMRTQTRTEIAIQSKSHANIYLKDVYWKSFD